MVLVTNPRAGLERMYIYIPGNELETKCGKPGWSHVLSVKARSKRRDDIYHPQLMSNVKAHEVEWDFEPSGWAL